jgi:hypothetical protein
MTSNIGDLLASDGNIDALPSRAKPSDPVQSDRVKIILEENENIPPTGQYIGVNGRAYILRPGEEALVPREVISVLNDAVQEVPQIDPTTKQVVGYRKKLRFPFRVVQSA